MSALITDIFQFHADRFLTVLMCLLFGMFLLCGARLRESQRGNRLFWSGIGLFLAAIGVTTALYYWRMPHGLFGSYYANPVWSDTPYVEMDSYFERGKNGQRVDRYLDFNPNDFNDRYPFSGKPFSVMWQGYVWLPADKMPLRVQSNFGAWLYVDDALVDGNHRLDFGSPDAAPFLREGWSHNEQWAQDDAVNFVWSSASRSEFYLAVDELTDYEFIFRCLPFDYRVSRPQEVTISLAGTRIGSVTLKEGWNIYRLPVPRSVLQQAAPGFFRVKFEYAYVTRPADVESSSTDTRELAAAFDFALLQKASAQSEPATAVPSFSRGLHRITLKAQSKAPNPFIRLVWKRPGDSKERMIPEDALFPITLSPEQIRQQFWLEKLGVGIAIALKSAILLFLGSVSIKFMVLPFMTLVHAKRFATPDALSIAGLFILTLGIRVYFLLENVKVDPVNFYYLPPGTDQLNYIFYARGFLRGYWPWYEFVPLRFNPLASLFLIVTHILFGENFLISRLAIAVLCSAGVMFLYAIARKHFGRTAAIIASLLYALNGMLILYSIAPVIEPFAMMLNLALLWYVERNPNRFSLKSAAIIGVLFGVLALGRPTFLLFMPCLFLWMLFTPFVAESPKPGQSTFAMLIERLRRNFLRQCAYWAVVGVAMLIVISPFTLRNYYASGQFVAITDAGGWNLWMSNNSHASGRYGFDPEFLHETTQHMRATGNSYFDEVLLFMKEQPAAYLRLEWEKCLMFWCGYEIPNLMNYYFIRDHSPLLQLPLVNFVILAPLAIVGMILLGKYWQPHFLLYAFVVVQLFINLLFFTVDRYRIPVLPILSLFAAYALCWCYRAAVERRIFRVIGVMALFVTLYVAMNYPYAAELYQQRYQRNMPLTQVFRYWDVFHFSAPE